MQEVALSLLVLLAGLPALDANDPEDKNSPFYYDWYSLRVGGLIFAGILCAMGIIVLMSECRGWGGGWQAGQGWGCPSLTPPLPLTGGKCKCKFRQKPR
uniref:FXYD domain-containing ion transport regulator n=1 Tax=Bos taurus TaxID=9913 RepID=A0AAA9SDK9_BOVIN